MSFSYALAQSLVSLFASIAQVQPATATVMQKPPAEDVLFKDRGEKIVALTRTGDCAALGRTNGQLLFTVVKEETGRIRATFKMYMDIRDIEGPDSPGGCAFSDGDLLHPHIMLTLPNSWKMYKGRYGSEVMSNVYRRALLLARPEVLQ